MTRPATLANMSPRAREIVAAARELLEQPGGDGLTMRRLAECLGIRAPSIYKHLPGKDALEAALISEGMVDLAERLEAASGAEGGQLVALGRAYRSFALDNPQLYRLMTDGPLRRDLLVPGVEAGAARPVIAAAGGDPDRGRALWAFLHGMVSLELNGRFPPDADLDAAWRRGSRAFSRRSSR